MLHLLVIVIGRLNCCLVLVHSESDTREHAFRDVYSSLWRHDKVVWIAKLPHPVNNDYLQKKDVWKQPESGEFTSFSTYIKYLDEEGDFKLEGHKLHLTFQLPIEDTFKCLTADDSAVAGISKTDYDAKDAQRDEIKKKMAAKRGKKGP